VKSKRAEARACRVKVNLASHKREKLRDSESETSELVSQGKDKIYAYNLYTNAA
jgi:hypothetical protein